jgi:hypothetical protein
MINIHGTAMYVFVNRKMTFFSKTFVIPFCMRLLDFFAGTFYSSGSENLCQSVADKGTVGLLHRE